LAASDSSFLLQQAVDLHQRGAVSDACNRYVDILRQEPRNVDALYLLGLARCQLGEYPEAIKHLKKATSLSPGHAGAHNTLCMALRETGNFADALASCDAAILHEPRFAEAYANRGDVLVSLQRPDEALGAYDRALELSPNLVPAWINRGSLLHELGRHRDAIESYDRAIAIAPEAAVAWLNRSKALHAVRQWDDALASCERALALAPGFPPALLARGIILRDRGDLADALSAFDRAIAAQPAWPDAHLERASVLQKQGNSIAALSACEQALAIAPKTYAAHQLHAALLYEVGKLETALASIERALAIKPDRPEGHAWRGSILIKLNRPADALAAFDRALAAGSTRGTTHIDRGLTLDALGRFEEAAAAFKEGCRLEGDDAHIQFVVGLSDLLHGRWIEGFARYERRLAVPNLNFLHRKLLLAGTDIEQRFATASGALPMYDFPRWAGEEPTGDPLLLETEQGMGDTVQFAGFAAHLARLGHRVQILTLPRMAPLLRCVPGVEAVLSDATALASKPKRWLPLMSLPHVLKITPDSVPLVPPWFSLDSARVEKWRKRLGNGGFKIGIAWQGNAQNWIDAGRSIPLAAFRPIADIAGVRLISLQMRPGAEQIDQVDFGDRIDRVMAETDANADVLLDTAALVATLDLVVTSDSMLAHLSGALGRETFIALRRVPEWRWLLAREDSPWYPTARLFRQDNEGDWTPVFARIANAIRPLVANAASISATVRRP
jgi:tetratricopeptide (TPR) repeat protein